MLQMKWMDVFLTADAFRVFNPNREGNEDPQSYFSVFHSYNLAFSRETIAKFQLFVILVSVSLWS